ncbi:MAG: beta strand repeat-containing protein, partial [Acidimicrobiales bacterium]
VNDLSGTDMTEVRSDLAASVGGDDGAVDTVVANGTGGDDTVSVVADGADAVVNGLAARVRVVHAAPGTDRLTVNGLDGNDTITATPEAGALIQLTLAP